MIGTQMQTLTFEKLLLSQQKMLLLDLANFRQLPACWCLKGHQVLVIAFAFTANEGQINSGLTFISVTSESAKDTPRQEADSSRGSRH
jgi:hypothetical protein